ncbi:hypothetical protein [Thalassospira alkalitolerans]|uniref:hypothetical protein n=1 Tax=Thalassospira alkalitolerans TaxID=1293890 RepID=UPI003AA8E80B
MEYQKTTHRTQNPEAPVSVTATGRQQKQAADRKDRRPSLSFDVSMHAADCFYRQAET